MSNTDQGPLTDSDIVPVFPIETRKRALPTFITRLVMGAKVMSPWRGRADIVVVEDVYGSTKISLPDFAIAKEVAEKISKELGLQRIVPAHQILVVRDRAQSILESMVDYRAGKHGIIMLKDSGGCGYWRMVLPSRYMDRKSVYVDVTGGAVDFDHLLEYDTVVVQRVHNWDSFYVLQRLKQAGKRIVYDIDDDLFSIPEDNPASKAIGRTEMMAAVECMKIADVVTTTTIALQERLAKLLGDKAPVIIPNALDCDDGWTPTPMTGSPDEWKRIFWQGSNTHDGDWNECFDAVNHIMRKRQDVRLIVLGYLPSLVKEKIDTPHWRNRIEYLGPMDPESYFRIIRHIRAEVGLAPLNDNWFNQGKSPIKWQENSSIGMPTVASNVSPYSEAIEHEKTGFLCSTMSEWIDAIESCLVDERLRRGMIENARKKIREEFDIKNTAKTWRDILVGDRTTANL